MKTCLYRASSLKSTITFLALEFHGERWKSVSLTYNMSGLPKVVTAPY